MLQDSDQLQREILVLGLTVLAITAILAPPAQMSFAASDVDYDSSEALGAAAVGGTATGNFEVTGFALEGLEATQGWRYSPSPTATGWAAKAGTTA